MSTRSIRDAALVLADGSTFEGEWFGAEPSEAGFASGEVVFNTALSGYQEIITDPSYAGQVVTFTYPHIGNYGVTAADVEGNLPPHCRGIVVRDLARRRSSWRAEGDLVDWLESIGVPGIAGIDTRRLTRVLRDTGAMPGAFGPLDRADEATLKQAAVAEPGTTGIDLVAEVTTREPFAWGERSADRPHVVAYDFGVKRSILDQIAEIATFEVFPASVPPEELLAREPDGIFLSNGPGDPEVVTYAVEHLRTLLGESVPIFGICLGHQLLALAAGAETVKLPFGHHGGNHPVKDLVSGRIDITSQNHNFAVNADTLAGIGEMTHVNLNDGVCEGMRLHEADAWSVQHHPEAGPGPHDARHLFEQFRTQMEKHQ